MFEKLKKLFVREDPAFPEKGTSGHLVRILRPSVQKRMDLGMSFDEAIADIQGTLRLGERMEEVVPVLRKEFVR